MLRWATQRRWRPRVVAAGLAVLAVAIVAVAFASGAWRSSQRTATPHDAVELATGAHFFQTPECAPFHGRRWVYPGTVQLSSTLYESFAINYPCDQAARWTARLTRKIVPFSKTGRLVTLAGPPGYRCGVWADANKHAYSGGCQKGNQAFGWNWNVANPHDYFAPDANGKPVLSKGSGADTQSILRTVSPNHYELVVMNTSGIGFINRFSWSPPPGWTVEAVTHASGAECRQDGANVACAGVLAPPPCLCAGGGSSIVVDFTVNGDAAGPKQTTGSVGAKLRLEAMTSVPFLIPGTPAEEAVQQKHGE